MEYLLNANDYDWTIQTNGIAVIRPEYRRKMWLDLFQNVQSLELPNNFRLGLNKEDLNNFDYSQPLYFDTTKNTQLSSEPIDALFNNIDAIFNIDEWPFHNIHSIIILIVSILSLLLVYLVWLMLALRQS
jgi:hypothetical protein